MRKPKAAKPETFDCYTCLDGSVLSDTCDICDTRHCQDCDPCEDEEDDAITTAPGRAAQLLTALQETYRRYAAGCITRPTCRRHLLALWAQAHTEGLTAQLWQTLTDMAPTPPPAAVRD